MSPLLSSPPFLRFPSRKYIAVLLLQGRVEMNKDVSQAELNQIQDGMRFLCLRLQGHLFPTSNRFFLAFSLGDHPRLTQGLTPAPPFDETHTPRPFTLDKCIGVEEDSHVAAS